MDIWCIKLLLKQTISSLFLSIGLRPIFQQWTILLKDMGEGRNNYNNNPAQDTETSSGAYTTARKASISPDLSNNSTRDRVSCDIHTEPTSSHNSN